MIMIDGVVENIIYENEKNGYTVCEVSSANQLITMTGYMPNLIEGEHIAASLWPEGGYCAVMETIIKKMIIDVKTLSSLLHISSTSFLKPKGFWWKWLTVLQFPLICHSSIQ